MRNGINKENSRNEASEYLPALVDKTLLTPKYGKRELFIDLYGDLAGILNTASEKKDMNKFDVINRFQLLPANDNSPEALHDINGSGGRI